MNPARRTTRRAVRPIDPGSRDLLKRIDSLPPLPGTVRIDRDASTVELSESVAREAALAVRIVRLVNSSYYGLRHRVEGVSRAVALLGSAAVRRIALTVSIREFVEGAGPGGALDRARFWRHSLAAAVCAHRLAAAKGLGDPADAYAAGFVHDLGKAVLDVLEPDAYARVVASVASGQDCGIEEKLLLGLSHPEVGGMLLASWDFPVPMRSAVRFHHSEALDLLADRSALELTAIAIVADWLCHEMDLPAVPGARAPRPERRVLDLVGFGRFDGVRLTRAVEAELPGVEGLIESIGSPDPPQEQACPVAPGEEAPWS